MYMREQKATQLSDAVIANCLKPMQTNGFFFERARDDKA